METCTRTLHTHAFQTELTPEFLRDSAIDPFRLLKEDALCEVRRTNPDAEVVEQKLVRGEESERERKFRDPAFDRQIWQVRTRFSTALPVVYPEI